MPLTRSVDKGSRLEFKDLTNALTGIWDYAHVVQVEMWAVISRAVQEIVIIAVAEVTAVLIT